MISLGMGVTASAIIGNEVGAGNILRAKKYAKACLIFVTCTNLPIIILFYVFRDEVASWYSYDPHVVDLVAHLFIFMTSFNLLDAFQTVLGGICKGLGLQKIAAVIVLIAYYIFAMPLGFVLAFYTDLSVYGLWIGLMVGGVLSVAALTIVLSRTSWKAITLEETDKTD
jgi:MATE family multidrug resistance protein